jgi:hypothetical protein
MLKLQIEWLNYKKYKPLFDAWEDEYVDSEDGRRFRAISLKKVIEIMDVGSIGLSDKIFKPIEEVLMFRYYLSNRRLKKGKFSIFELLKIDSSYFSEHRKLIGRASELLSTLEKRPYSTIPTNEIWDEISILLTCSNKKYKFEDALTSTLKQILLDEPKFGMGLPFKDPWDPCEKTILFNEHLYTQSRKLYHSLKEEFVYEKITTINRSNSFIGGWMAANDSAKRREQEINNRYISHQEFDVAVKDDLENYYKC